MKTFLQLIDELKDVVDPSKQKDILSEIIIIADQNPNYVVGVFYNVIMHFIHQKLGQDFMKVINSDFSKIKIKIYDDETGKRLSVGIMFVQDYRSYRNDVDNKILSNLVEALQENHLNIFVNDITVNNLHIYNF